MRRAFLAAGLVAVLAAPAPQAQTLDPQAAWSAALAQDPQWRAAQAAADAGAMLLPLADAARQPRVTLDGQLGVNQLDQVQPSFFSPRGVSTTQNYGSHSAQLTVRHGVHQPALVAALPVARAQGEEATAQARRARQDLASRLFEAYLAVLDADARLQHQQRLLALHERQAEQARAALAAGTGTRTDIDEALARQDLTRAQQIEWRQQRALALRQLALLTGQPVQAVWPVAGARLDPEAEAGPALEAWLEQAEADSPELAAARARLDAARAEVERSRQLDAATVDLVAQFGRTQSDSANAVGTRRSSASLGLQLSVPLWSGERSPLSARRALAEQERQAALLDALRQDLSQRLLREHQGVTLGAERLRALVLAERSAQTALESARRSQRAGVRTAVDVLQAEQQLAQVARDLALAQHQWLLSWVRLRTLAGGFGEAEAARLAQWLQPPA